MNTKEHGQLLLLPPQEYCDKIREMFPQNTGYAYKIEIPFEECKPEDIVYIPERSYKELPLEITYYTKQDILSMCEYCEELAEYIFESLEWQYPETYMQELISDFTDIVIDYDYTKTITSPIAKTLYEMMSDEEKIQVYYDCLKKATEK